MSNHYLDFSSGFCKSGHICINFGWVKAASRFKYYTAKLSIIEMTEVAKVALRDLTGTSYYITGTLTLRLVLIIDKRQNHILIL